MGTRRVNHLSWQHMELLIDRQRQEIARLREALEIRNGRHLERINRAYEAALLLAGLHFAYQATTRQAVTAATGLSQRQWTNAVTLLRLARVVTGRRRLVWHSHDYADIEKRLETARQRAIECPDCFQARLPRHARR